MLFALSLDMEMVRQDRIESPILLFYPQQHSYRQFDVGEKITPSKLEKAFKWEEIVRQRDAWQEFNLPGKWAAEVYPDFPWWEALWGCTIYTTPTGYQASLNHNIFLEKMDKNWLQTYLSLHERLLQHLGKGDTVALPPLLGATALGKRVLKGNEVLHLSDQIMEQQLSVFKTILLYNTTGVYIASGSFLSASLPIFVWKEYDWVLPIAHEIAKMRQRIKATVPSLFFLWIPFHALRYVEPALPSLPLEGIIVEKEVGSPLWEDLLPMFKVLQELKLHLILAGAPAVEDWIFARKQLDLSRLTVLFQTVSLQEAKQYFEYLLGNNRKRGPLSRFV